MRWHRFVILLVLSGWSGCSCSDSTSGGPHTRFLSEGSGVENAEPLWPMVPGWIGASGASSISIVHDPITIGGTTMMRLSGPLPFVPVSPPSGPGLPSQIGPVEPVAWAFFSHGEEGLLLHGFMRDAIWEVPVLFLPTTVRVGMVWDAFLADGTLRYRFSIRSVDYRPTRFGPRRVWTLEIFDTHLRKGYFPPGDVRIEHGVTFTMELIEGRGPLDTVVAPLDPPRAAPQPPRVAVRALDDGTPVTAGAPGPIEARWEPARGGAATLTVTAVVSRISQSTDPFDPNPIVGGSGVASTCALYTPGTGFAEPGADACVGAASSLITPTQTVTFACADGAPTQCPDDHPEAVFQGADGRYYVHGSRNPDNRDLVWSELALPAPGTGPVCCPFAAPIHQTATPIFDAFGYSTLALGYGTFDPGLWVAPAPQDPGFVVIGRAPTEYLAFGRLDAARARFADVHLGYASKSELSWSLTTAGREGVRTYPDGRVELLDLTRNGVAIRTFDLDLPPQAVLGGAVVHDGKLLAVAGRGFRGNDDQFTADGLDPAFPQDFGQAYAYEADVPPGLVATSDARFSIIAERPADVARNGVARVCVPPAAGPVSAAGWMVNGRPARFASTSRDDSCVDLLFTPPELGTDASGQEVQGDQDAYELIGTLPTIGRVALWPRMSATTYVGPGDAPLVDGGSVSVNGYVRDELGFLDTVTDTTLDTLTTLGEPVASLPDLAGAGLWGTVNTQQDLVLISRGVTQRWPGLGRPLVAVAGGGVVVAAGLVRPGDAVPMPLPILPGNFERTAVLADGSQCGFTVTALRARAACVDVQGQLREYPPYVDQTIADGQGGVVAVPMFAVGNTLYLVQPGPDTIDRVLAFDRDLNLVTTYGARLLGFAYNHPLDLPFVRFAPDGDAYLTVGNNLLAFRRGGIERAALPADAPLMAFGTAVFTTRDMFVFHSDGIGVGGPRSDVKVPRAEVAFTPIDPAGDPCPPGEHACSVYCRADGPDDIANGCRTGCAACVPPPFATAQCSDGACDFTCDATHPRVGSSCACTPLACGARECGPPDCGPTVSCGTCAATEVCNDGTCECRPDSTEGTTPPPLTFGAPVAATLHAPGDVDTFTASAFFVAPGAASYAVRLTGPATGTSEVVLELHPTMAGCCCTTTCTTGVQGVGTSGFPTCTATVPPGHPAGTPVVAADTYCAGFQHSDGLDVTVRATAWDAACMPYDLTLSRTPGF